MEPMRLMDNGRTTRLTNPVSQREETQHQYGVPAPAPAPAPTPAPPTANRPSHFFVLCGVRRRYRKCLLVPGTGALLPYLPSTYEYEYWVSEHQQRENLPPTTHHHPLKSASSAEIPPLWVWHFILPLDRTANGIGERRFR